MSLRLLLLAYAAFISLGLPDGLLGVGWPSMSADFDVRAEAVGALLLTGTAGYLTSSVLAGFTMARLGVGRLLAASTALTAAALAGYSISPGLAVLAALGLLAGLGAGAIDAGLNAYAASAFGPKHMNWMHACFGLGVAIGPIIMTGVLAVPASWRWGYGIVAAAQLGLALTFVRSAGSWSRASAPSSGSGPDHAGAAPVDPDSAAPVEQPGVATAAAQPSVAAQGPLTPAAHSAVAAQDPYHSPVEALVPERSRHVLALPAVWFGVLAFGVYVAVEISAGLWAFLFLTEARGMGAAAAGVCVSGYWGCLFVGRVVQGVVAERIGTARVLSGSLLGMAAGAALIAVPAGAWLAVLGLGLLGFAAAPVFPLLTLTTADRVGAEHTDRAIGLQIAGAGLGGALLPTVIGALLTRTDLEALGPALLALTLLLLGLHGAAARQRSAAG